jgi:ABC-2 type transport system ATP-binding protein
MKILKFKNVIKNYLNFNLNVSFSLNRGETIGFVGQNGAGKTTTMNIMLNIVKKDAGEVLIFGEDHIKKEALIKERMGVILEDHNFYKDIKINFLLKFCSEIYPNWDKEYAEYLRKKLNLTENKKYKELSKGMKVKFSIIIALSHNAEFLLFDEPISGLDPKVRNDILEEIELIKKKTILLFFFFS